MHVVIYIHTHDETYKTTRTVLLVRTVDVERVLYKSMSLRMFNMISTYLLLFQSYSEFIYLL